MFFYIKFLLMFGCLTSLGIYMKMRFKDMRTVQWAALISISGGLTGLQVVLEHELLPGWLDRIHPRIGEAISFLTWLLNVLVNTFPYYAILVFFLVYNGLPDRYKWVTGVLSLPIWMTILFQPDLGSHVLHLPFIAFWGGAYLLAAVILALRPMIQASTMPIRMYHLAIGLIFLVPESVIYLYQLAGPPLSDVLLSRLPYFGIGSMLLFLLVYLRGAFTGLQRESVEAVRAGTGLIHHSLINSISKVKLHAVNIRGCLEHQRYQEIEVHIQGLLAAHEAMMTTISNIAQVVNGRLELHPDKHELDVLIDEAAVVLSKYPGILLERENEPGWLLVDKQAVTECLVQIFRNAREAMKENGRIQIRTERRWSTYVLVISDSGPGMTPSQLQKICNPFYSTKHRTGQHVGLGLYYVKKVMAAHHGKLEITSNLNQGTEVRLIFKHRGDNGDRPDQGLICRG